MSVPPSPFGRNPNRGFPAGQTTGAGPTPGSTKPDIPNPTAIATELWILVIVAQAVIYGSQYSRFMDTFDDMAKDQPDLQVADPVVWVSFGLGGAVIAAGCGVLVWLARTGYNWARLVLGFVSFYLVVSMVSAFFADNVDDWVMIPTVLSGVAALGAGVLLMHRDSDKYCKDSARWRKDKKRQPPSYFNPSHHNPSHHNTPYPGQPFYGQQPQYGQQAQYGQPEQYGYQPPQYGQPTWYPPATPQPPAGPTENHPTENHPTADHPDDNRRDGNRPESGDRT